MNIAPNDYCYPFVAGMLTNHLSWGLARAAFAGRDLSKVLSDLPSHFEGKHGGCGIALDIHLRQVMLDLVSNATPKPLSFAERALPASAPMESPWGVPGHDMNDIRMTAAIFVFYFESLRDANPQLFAHDLRAYPTIDFCRVLRNSLAHGNRVYIRNANAPAVSWRSILISPANNGQPVLWELLVIADLISLMKDADDEVSHHNARP